MIEGKSKIDRRQLEINFDYLYSYIQPRSTVGPGSTHNNVSSVYELPRSCEHAAFEIICPVTRRFNDNFP